MFQKLVSVIKVSAFWSKSLQSLMLWAWLISNVDITSQILSKFVPKYVAASIYVNHLVMIGEGGSAISGQKFLNVSILLGDRTKTALTDEIKLLISG